MLVTRRHALCLGVGAAAAVGMGLMATPVLASVDAAMKAVLDFAGGKQPQTGRITLTTPEIAENGNTVPVSVSVDSPMTEDAYVEEVLILANGNPNPGVARFKFSPLSGNASATTRIRLAKTQDVIAVARMSDGSTFMDSKTVKVTIGGCGG